MLSCVTVQCPATDASNNETWSLHTWSRDLLRDRGPSIYIKTDTQLWETETAVVNDIVQTLCFVYYCFLRKTLSIHCSQLTYNYINIQPDLPMLSELKINRYEYFYCPQFALFPSDVSFDQYYKYFILYQGLKLHSVLFWYVLVLIKWTTLNMYIFWALKYYMFVKRLWNVWYCCCYYSKF